MPGAGNPSAAIERQHLRFHRQLQENSLAKVIPLRRALDKVEGGLAEAERALEETRKARLDLQERVESVRHRKSEAAMLGPQVRKETQNRLLELFAKKFRRQHVELDEADKPPQFLMYLTPSERDSLPQSIADLREHPVFDGLFTHVECRDDSEQVEADCLSEQKERSRILSVCEQEEASVIQENDDWLTVLFLTDPTDGQYPARTGVHHHRPAAVLQAATLPHAPSQDDELRIEVGDRIQVMRRFEDGWMSGFNLTAESERPSERSIGFFRSASIDRVLSPLAASTTSSPGVCLQSLPSQPDLRQSLPDQRPSHPTPRSVDSTAHYLRFRDVLHSFVQQLATEHLRLVLAYARLA
ncbi:hypothetical protein JCM10049v2_003865 [Rhodotorula toruloides]